MSWIHPFIHIQTKSNGVREPASIHLCMSFCVILLSNQPANKQTSWKHLDGEMNNVIQKGFVL